MPAESTDIDHLIPFDHDDPARGGPTAEHNLLCFCRRHHRFKTFGDWTYSMTADGVLTIDTPDGRRMTTYPSGPLAQWRQQEQDAPRRGNPPTPSEKPQPTYWHRRAQRIAAEREAAIADRAQRRAQADARREGLSRARREAGLEGPPKPDGTGPAWSLSTGLDPREATHPVPAHNPDSQVEHALAMLLAHEADPPPF